VVAVLVVVLGMQSAAQGYIEPFYGVDIAIRKNLKSAKAASKHLALVIFFSEQAAY